MEDDRLKILNWNLNRRGETAAPQWLNYLKERDWDILTLQEVTGSAKKALTGLAADSAYGLDLCDSPSNKQPHGAAVLVKSPYRIARKSLVRGIPKPERGVSVQVIDQEDNNRALRIVSWHSPNKSGEGAPVKMQGYRGLINHLDESSSPTIVGFDANHWNLRTELTPEPAPEQNDCELENRFFSSEATHNLRDAFLDYLASHPDIHADIVERNPQGPLATSYVHGKQRDRFDYIFVSEHFAVDHCEYDEDVREHGKGACKRLSDHASVSAELRLR